MTRRSILLIAVGIILLGIGLFMMVDVVVEAHPAPVKPDTPPVPAAAPAKHVITGAVLFKVDGDPEWIVFVFQDGTIATVDTDVCNAESRCTSLVEQLIQLERLKQLDVITKQPDTKS